MYYVELLRVRRMVTIFAAIMASIVLLLWLSFTISKSGLQSHMHVQGGPAVIPLGILVLVACYCASFIATALGTSLCGENDGHLELAWTKPISRTGYALRLMAVDIVGILISGGVAIGAIVAAISALGLGHYIAAGPRTLLAVALGIGVALAWYAVIQGLTASLKHKAAGVSGFAWPVAFGLALLALATPPSALHNVAVALNFLNPLAYLTSVQIGSDVTAASSTLLPLSMIARIVGVYCLALAGILAALVQWRRLEA